MTSASAHDDDTGRVVRLLRIYLNDHRAGAAAGQTTAERCQNANSDSDLGRYLIEFLDELRVDVSLLDEIRAALQAGPSTVKEVVATVAAHAGRLKLNGSVWSYSPLSRVVELEALILGVHGKLLLWQALRTLATDVAVLEDFDLETAQSRATDQLDRLKHFREQAVKALGDN